MIMFCAFPFYVNIHINFLECELYGGFLLASLISVILSAWIC